MNDSAHDTEHIYRVLYYALDIAKHESNVDIELLTVACLLHDIGREAQIANHSIDHATYGAEMAYNWLLENGYSQEFAQKAKVCISTHRYRSDNPPQSLEAKILFDSDKLEACGAVGIARTLQYKSNIAEPLYMLDENGQVSDGTMPNEVSFLQEYKFKLEKIYDRFYTQRGNELAASRKGIAKHFYEAVLAEVRECYARGANSEI